ncbi:hypothetical protein CWI36_1399p0010 [Hamiltosporidium magnivora]|uniref:Uncharacterized protein n=1 Tax=Hamiltosporidium magnivora TaxID=148818 RepID=A0A4Q9L1J7_9MICR|nr:hypothetical protein CWI36_1399p0010 [Hamiltosporidium magnivora]
MVCCKSVIMNQNNQAMIVKNLVDSLKNMPSREMLGSYTITRLDDLIYSPNTIDGINKNDFVTKTIETARKYDEKKMKKMNPKIVRRIFYGLEQ